MSATVDRANVRREDRPRKLTARSLHMSMSASHLRRPSRTASLLLLGLLSACEGTNAAPEASAVAVSALPAHDGELRDGFTMPGAFVELSDGRVVISDPSHRELWMADFSTGERVAIGRLGDGPGEFRAIRSVFKLAGDSIAVSQDGPLARVAVLSPDGTAVRTIALTADPTPAAVIEARGYAEWTAQPKYSDARGRMYGARPRLPLGMELDTSWSREYQLMRINPATGAIDSLGRVPAALDGTRPRPLGDGSGFEIDLFPGAHTPQQTWQVLEDGTVAIVDGATYEIRFVSPDTTRRVRVPHDVRPLTPEAWRRYTDTAAATQQRMMRGAVPMDGPAGTPLEFTVRIPPAPATMPATLSSPRRGLLTDGRELWIPVPAAGDDPLAHERWDVIDAQGTRRGIVELPPRTVLLGVSARHVYTATIDDDDVRTVRRHPRVP